MTSPGEDPNQKEASTDGVIGRFESNPKEATASVEIAMVGEMLASYGLDPGQQAALVHALTSRLAIIQGPPGCGKTFVGLNLVKLLLSMEPRPPTPILVLTYKNHALDEFLKGLLSFLNIRDIVRIGGGSQVKELDACNLRNMEKIKMDQRMLNEMNALRDNIRDVHEQVQENMKALHEASLLTKQDLLDVWEERQLRQFLLAAPYRYGKKRRVEELVSSVPSGSNLLLKCLQEGGNTKEEEALFDLFQDLLEKWVPSDDCFFQLKNLQTQVSDDELQVGQACLSQPATSDEEEHLNEEVVEAIMEARLAAHGESGRRRKQKGTRSNVLFLKEMEMMNTVIVQFDDFPPNMVQNEKLLRVSSLWDMNDGQKVCLLYTVLSQKIEENTASLNEAIKRLDSLTKSLNEITAHQKAKFLQRKQVLGMTITGASINHQLIQEVAPAIVIVEEAAEVLEADLLAALTPGLQHLILIGDHKQLRPKVDTYNLKTNYNFDLSMMERLIGNKFPFKMLTTQNRMRPEFSKLLLDIYPDLQDNLARVEKQRPADGIGKSMLFWNHEHSEQSGQSFSNREEARRAVLLAQFLMVTGIKASQITILAAYQGQVTEIKSLVRKWDDGEQVQVSTIDRFQGDENDFIIISLVRSNSIGAIGFLMEESRRCVAQSRARCGMYLIGNAATLSEKPCSPWTPLLNTMKEGGWVSDTLNIRCTKHMEVETSIADAEALKHILQLPARLCKLTCGFVYSCGVWSTCLYKDVHSHP